MNMYDFASEPTDKYKDKRFIFTDLYTGEGRLVNPMVYEFHRAWRDFEIWYLSLFLVVRAIFIHRRVM